MLARDPHARARRCERLRDIRAAFLPLPVDEEVGEHFGDVLAIAHRERRITKATDLLIIATARCHGRALRTADARQARLARAAGVRVVDG